MRRRIARASASTPGRTAGEQGHGSPEEVRFVGTRRVPIPGIFPTTPSTPPVYFLLVVLAYAVLCASILLSTGCGGAFAPPPRPDTRMVCIQDLATEEILNCPCWRLEGSFWWKRYVWYRCPAPDGKVAEVAEVAEER